MSWRRHWLVGNWLSAFPLIRITALPSWQQILFALGADLLMITGMVVGMDLGSEEVAFLSAEAGPAAVRDQAFGHLIGAMITITMIFGMAAGMILERCGVASGPGRAGHGGPAAWRLARPPVCAPWPGARAGAACGLRAASPAKRPWRCAPTAF